MVRASLCANSAADTPARIDPRDSVFNANRAVRTSPLAVAQAETAVGAAALSAVQKLCGGAGFDSLILNLVLSVFAVARAVDNRHLLNNVLKLHAQNLAELFCNTVGAGNTEVCRHAAVLAERLCVAVAACIAAGSAVCSGQTFPNLREPLVLLDRHNF